MITPPTSSSLNARQAPARSLVKTPVWSPNIESLTRAMASSRSRNGKATTSGANASFEQTWAVVGTSVRTVGGKNVPSALPPSRTLPPSATASSTQRWVRPAAVASTIGPTSVVGSSGSPTLSACAPATNLSMNASQMSSWTNIRWTLMQTWPA